MRNATSFLIAAATLVPLTLSAQAPIFDSSRPPAREENGDQRQRQQRKQEGGNLQQELYFKLQQLQKEVTELRGKVEQQENELRKLKQQSLDRYIELDRRVGELSGNLSPGKSSDSQSASPSSKEASDAEIDAYQQAYNLIKSQKFSDAISAFKGFIDKYPDGRYAPNAWYWLGELYLVNTPQDLEASEKAFRHLLENYPEDNKVPDAKYKLGKVYYMQDRRDKAKQLLKEVTSEHGDSSASKMAEDFLRENF